MAEPEYTNDNWCADDEIQQLKAENAEMRRVLEKVREWAVHIRSDVIVRMDDKYKAKEESE